ncbi:hypothetical protein EMCRGX_G024938 [Ephydatia muelleri]
MQIAVEPFYIGTYFEPIWTLLPKDVAVLNLTGYRTLKLRYPACVRHQNGFSHIVMVCRAVVNKFQNFQTTRTTTPPTFQAAVTLRALTKLKRSQDVEKVNIATAKIREADTGKWTNTHGKEFQTKRGVVTKVIKMIDELYEDMMLKLKDMLKQSSSVSLTTDAAKMPTGDSYVAITGHWISSGDWITHYGIGDQPKNASASTNATSELIAVFRKLVNKIHGSSLLTENLRSAQSGGPIINVLVEDEQDDEEHQVNEGASDAAPKDASFHSSPRGHTLKLIKDVITRWNSTYYMLARCVLLEVPLRKLVEELGLEGPADNDWSTAQLLLSRKISQLMLYLSRPKPPQSWGLGKTWADLPKAVSCMRDFVLADIKRRWDTGNLLLGMAAVVDPRHISLEWLTPLQQQTIKQQLLKEMFAVAGVPSDNDALEKDDDYDDESTIAARQANSDEQDACRSLRDAVKEEYDVWLRLHEIRAVDFTTHLDPMEWWKMHNSQFPTIAILARKYLAIPASSAPSERVFSKAKLIQERQR